MQNVKHIHSQINATSSSSPARHKPFLIVLSWSELLDQTLHSLAQSLSEPLKFQSHSHISLPFAVPQQLPPTKHQLPLTKCLNSVTFVNNQTYNPISKLGQGMVCRPKGADHAK